MEDEERKPDLVGPDYDEAEKRVDKMMEPAQKLEKPAKKSIKITEDGDMSDDAELASAPEVETPKSAKKITIVHHEDEPDAEPEEAESAPDEEVPTESEEQTEEAKVEDETVEPDDVDAEPTDDEVVEDESTPVEDVESTTEDDEVEEDTQEVVEESETPVEEELPAEGKTIQEAMDDAQTTQIVDDIVAQEGDDLLEADDDKLADAFTGKKPTLGQKLKNFFYAWWHNKLARRVTIAVVLLGLATLVAVPKTRYMALNSVGVRGATSLSVLDDSTQQPLKNVEVSVAGQTAQTDIDGKVKLTKLKLGSTDLVVKKRAFAEVRKKITLGWGSNPLGEVKLTPRGSQFTLSVSDFLSSKAIEKVEASSGDASAVSNDKGEIKLTIDQPGDTVEVTIKGTGFRDENLKFSGDTKDTQKVKMVPARKHVFVTKRSGKYDVYKIDADGKNEKLVLAGTGSERDDMVLVMNSTDDLAALVSTRDTQRNADGYLLSTLTLLNLKAETTTKLAQSERVQVVDWIGGRLVYVQIAAGASAGNPRRHRLLSYDPKDGSSKELASSNYFNDVISVSGKIYYAPSSAYAGGSAVGFYQVDGDGNSKQTIMADETWNAFRTSYDHIVLSIGQKWFDYHIGESTPAKLDGAPANLTNRPYVDSPDGKRSLWVDTRDGKGVLIAYDTSTKKETTLKTQSGLKNPVRWLTNNTIVYRINTEQETADYVYNLDGGEPVKIRDVTNTGGIDKWYYY